MLAQAVGAGALRGGEEALDRITEPEEAADAEEVVERRARSRNRAVEGRSAAQEVSHEPLDGGRDLAQPSAQPLRRQPVIARGQRDVHHVRPLHGTGHRDDVAPEERGVERRANLRVRDHDLDDRCRAVLLLRNLAMQRGDEVDHLLLGRAEAGTTARGSSARWHVDVGLQPRAVQAAGSRRKPFAEVLGADTVVGRQSVDHDPGDRVRGGRDGAQEPVGAEALGLRRVSAAHAGAGIPRRQKIKRTEGTRDVERR